VSDRHGGVFWGARVGPAVPGHGTRLRLMAPKFVGRVIGRAGKNDATIAEAICEAVTRAEHAFRAVKFLEQQALAGDTPGQAGVRRGEDCDHQTRLRGLLCEFGVVLPLRSVTVRRQAAQASRKIARSGARRRDLLDELRSLDERIGGHDREIEAQAKLCGRHSV